MYSELIKALRNDSSDETYFMPLAADTIESLTAENAELKAEQERLNTTLGNNHYHSVNDIILTVGRVIDEKYSLQSELFKLREMLDCKCDDCACELLNGRDKLLDSISKYCRHDCYRDSCSGNADVGIPDCPMAKYAPESAEREELIGE